MIWMKAKPEREKMVCKNKLYAQWWMQPLHDALAACFTPGEDLTRHLNNLRSAWMIAGKQLNKGDIYLNWNGCLCGAEDNKITLSCTFSTFIITKRSNLDGNLCVWKLWLVLSDRHSHDDLLLVKCNCFWLHKQRKSHHATKSKHNTAA